MCLVSVPHLQVLNYNRAKWYFITSRFVEFFYELEILVICGRRIYQNSELDVVRPKSSVDKG